MDNLTHTLTGLMLSRAGLDRFHPRAPVLLMIAANIPDVDVVSLVGGTATYLHFHRWMTHALISLPFMALLPVLIVRLLFRKQPVPWRTGWLLSLMGVASHLLLDLTNPYGIRLFLPFDNSWPMLSITSVVDFWFWTTLLLATFAPMLGRLVSSEIGAKPESGRGWAIVALALLTFYDAGRWFLHERAVSLQMSRMYNGETPRRALAFPDKLNPLRWEGIVETPAFFVVQDVDLTKEFDPTGKVLYKPAASPAIQSAAQDPLFRRFVDFAKVLFWTVTPASDIPGGTRVIATDLYFGFAVTGLLDANHRVISSDIHF